MARPAHTNIPDGDVDLDSALKTTNVGKRLRDNALAGRINLVAYKFTEEDSVTRAFGANTYGDHVDQVPIRLHNVADYTGIQRLIRLRVQAKTASGATGTYRLKDQASGDTGGEVTTSSGTYVLLSMTLNLTSAMKGTDRVIILEYKSSSGSNAAFAKRDPAADGYLEY